MRIMLSIAAAALLIPTVAMAQDAGTMTAPTSKAGHKMKKAKKGADTTMPSTGGDMGTMPATPPSDGMMTPPTPSTTTPTAPSPTMPTTPTTPSTPN
jgi:hypothetical protein